jgi:hypothetical protein
LIGYLATPEWSCVESAGDHTKFDEGARNEIEAYFTAVVITLIISIVHVDDAPSVTSRLKEWG